MANCFHALIVEDDPAIVELLISMLEESQYHVSSASTVAEALAFLRTSHVDVVLADNLLPDGRGSEVACVAEDLGSVVIEMSDIPRIRMVLNEPNAFIWANLLECRRCFPR